ncbi:MAG: TRAP transporter small permease [Acetobacteraceae bacterium]|nr:TRAP transporter small permease [Acetobacteraceae bacterium]MCX7684717.1 TRAP transporter small permease [Acetobacteraceae bacterium]MDW8397652.1 TRAP transporter small permease [Acetobacteraceae bacterium]
MLRLLARVSLFGAWAGGALMLASALLVAADVLARNAFAAAPFASLELSRYAFAAAIAFGMAHALVARAHIRIDVLHRLLPRRWHGPLDVLALGAMAPLASLFAWHAWEVVRESARLGAVSNSPLAVPLPWPQGVWAAGFTWFAAVSWVLLAWALLALLRRRHGEVAAIGGMPGLSEEMPG